MIIPFQYLAKEAFLSFEIVREAKIVGEEFGTGTIVKVSCPSDMYLNLQNANLTAKCSRNGRWKPVKPACLPKKRKLLLRTNCVFFLRINSCTQFQTRNRVPFLRCPMVNSMERSMIWRRRIGLKWLSRTLIPFKVEIC